VITGGEALLRPDTLDLVRHACNVGMVVELLSNGIACDDRTCEQIVLSGVDRITFSLDGITPQTHASIRGIPDNFVRTLEAIEHIDKHRKKYRSEIKILIKTVIMRKNIHEVVAIGDWITSQGKVEWRVQPIEQNYGERDNPLWYKTSDLWITDLKAVKHLVSELKQRKKDGCPLQNDFQSLDYIASYFAHPDTYMRAIQSHNLPGLDWTPPANFEVSAAGDVRFSFMLQPAGNLKNSSPKDIWNRRHQNTEVQP
jgi:MoaA/NifB/PqqE/SkfB family radical SAM enzyme